MDIFLPIVHCIAKRVSSAIWFCGCGHACNAHSLLSLCLLIIACMCVHKGMISALVKVPFFDTSIQKSYAMNKWTTFLIFPYFTESLKGFYSCQIFAAVSNSMSVQVQFNPSKHRVASMQPKCCVCTTQQLVCH